MSDIYGYRTATAVVIGLAEARRVIDAIARQSQWYGFTPLPDDEYEIAVKKENAVLLDRLANPGRTDRGHLHAEAFCLMWYRCRSCGHQERFYNTRDGVTPFVTSGHCPNCPESEMQHGGAYPDEYAPDHVPQPGEGIFLTMPDDLKPVFGRRNWHRYYGEGHEDLPDQATFVAQHVDAYQMGAPLFMRWPGA